MRKIKLYIKKLLVIIRDKYELFLIKFEIGRKEEMSISDLLICNSDGSELLRCDIIIRYLAISEYLKNSDKGFELYRLMQEKRIGKERVLEAEKKFKELIQSYETHGYNDSSRIVVDKNLKLIDGSHRIAMALYYGYDNISVLIINRKHNVSYSIDWFVENGFNQKQLKWITNTSSELTKNNKNIFSCVIWSPAASLIDQIKEDIKYFGTVTNIKKYSYRKEEYKNIVRAIYAIDDIERWKIEKKIEYMEPYNPELIAIDLIIKEPCYRLKKSTGLPLSTVGERIKRCIRGKYKNQINKYFFDIIMHIGDNIYQSNYMRDVLENSINFVDIVSMLNKYNYAFLKIDVPYMPIDFPNHIPIGKDADIICSKESFSTISDALIKISKAYHNYSIVICNEKYGIRIRFQRNKILVYQIDVSYYIEDMKNDFVSDALKRRKLKDAIYILDNKYEYVYRTYVYNKNPNKTYHKKYLQEHIDDYNEDMIKKYLRSESNV